jgi:hypothetical protein
MTKKLLIVFLLFTCFAKAQLQIDNTLTPAQLVQNVLVGQGVVPFNIQFNRSFPAATAVRDQAARFYSNFNPTGLGLDAGILLTTGQSSVALGPNGAGNRSLATTIPVEGDVDLATLTGQPVRSVSIVEFDFVATGLILNFDYVFASEEYPEYSISVFNDVFGFFLSGPGLAGPYAGGAINIARTPTTNTGSNVVSIGNVNNGNGNAGPCNNCTYYVNNTIVGTPSHTSLQYDGFTVPLRATAPLICGQTYHIKLAISNTTDSLWDSAVFIKNFRIEPLVLVDNLGLSDNPFVCFGETVTISSGVTPSANILKWYKDGVLLPLETGPNLITTEPGVYTFEEYTPAGCRLAVDDITIGFLPDIAVTQPLNLTSCNGSFNIDQTGLIISTLASPSNYGITYYNTNAGNEATNGSINGVIPDTDLATYPIAGSSAVIWVRIEDLVDSGCSTVKSFNLNVTSASGTFSYSGSPYCNNDPALKLPTLFALTSGGTFSATPAGLSINPATGAIDGIASTVGVYTVSYDIAATALCPAFNTTATVEVVGCSCTVTASSASQTVCVNTPITSITYTSSTVATTGSVPIADLPPGVTGAFAGNTFTISGTPNTPGTYTFSVTLETGTSDSCSIATTIVVNAQPNAGLDGSTTVCDNLLTPIDLSSLITCEQTGGTWTRLLGTGGTFNA